MRNLLIILVFFICIQQSIAQQGNLFDFQIHRLDDTQYEMRLQFINVENVQFVQIRIMDRGQDVKTLQASLNKKGDGKYYLFFEGKESFVNTASMTIVFSHEMEEFIDVNIGLLKEPTILVELLDRHFNILESLHKNID